MNYEKLLSSQRFSQFWLSSLKLSPRSISRSRLEISEKYKDTVLLVSIILQCLFYPVPSWSYLKFLVIWYTFWEVLLCRNSLLPLLCQIHQISFSYISSICIIIICFGMYQSTLISIFMPHYCVSVCYWFLLVKGDPCFLLNSLTCLYSNFRNIKYVTRGMNVKWHLIR